MARNTILRSLHDAGLAAWAGGTLANAVALNPAAGATDSARDTGRVTNTGWDRWTPVNAAAIGAHLIGSTGLLLENRGRVAAQHGVAGMTIAKTALTGAALAATTYSRVLGRRISEHTDVPLESGTHPTSTTPEKVAAAQQQLRILQWAIPALTGSLIVLNALAGEQQRPSEVARGLLQRLTP